MSSELQYLADMAAAEYIISAKQMKEARKRVELWESQQKHLCFTRCCEEPVVGERIYLHCSNHLDEHEIRWFEERVEQSGFENLYNGPLKKALLIHDVAEVKEQITKKESALDDAYKRVEEFWQVRRLRREMLPSQLLRRLVEYETSLFDVDAK